MIVLPPRANLPFSTFFSIDSSIAFQSTPSCPKKFWSSEERTAWMRWRETRESGTQDWATRGFRPFFFASSARWSIRRVRSGLFVASARTSERAGRPTHSHVARVARTRAAASRRRKARRRMTGGGIP